MALRVTGTKPQCSRAVNGSGRVLLEPWACFGVVLLRDSRAGSQVGAVGRELADSTVPGLKPGQGHPPRRAALPCPWLCESCSACTLTTMIHRGFLEKKTQHNNTAPKPDECVLCENGLRGGASGGGDGKVGWISTRWGQEGAQGSEVAVGTQRCSGQCSASPASSFIPAKRKESSIYPSRAGCG